MYVHVNIIRHVQAVATIFQMMPLVTGTVAKAMTKPLHRQGVAGIEDDKIGTLSCNEDIALSTYILWSYVTVFRD